MSKNRSRIGFFSLMVGFGLLPSPVVSQVWEAQAAWVRIDHNHSGHVTRSGEQVPDGLGISISRSLGPSDFFLELEFSRGSEVRRGAICGGFIQPGDCVAEQVQYSGGVSRFSLAWLGEKHIGDSWSIGIRPEIGLGLLRANEDGKETGKDFSERQTSASIGIGAEVGFKLPGREGFQVSCAATWNHLRPILVDLCDDCRWIFHDPLSQNSVGVGIRWTRNSRAGDSR